MLIVLFDGDLELIKRAYLSALRLDRSIDHGGGAFGELLDIDSGFAVEYVQWVYSVEKYPSRHDDSRDYTFLWKREDAEAIVRSILQAVINLDRPSFFGSISDRLLRPSRETLSRQWNGRAADAVLVGRNRSVSR